MENTTVEVPLNEEMVKEQLAQKTDKQVIEEFLTENRDMLEAWAMNLNNVFRGNWFGLEQVIKKSPFKNLQEALYSLNMLKLSGLLVSRINEKRKREEYRITLDNSSKIKKLEEEKSRLLKLILSIDKELELLQTETIKENTN